VVSENHGDIVFTEKFQGFIDEMTLSMYVCRKNDPESKGKVENLVKFVKRSFLAARDFQDLEEAKVRLRQWLSRRGNGRTSQATKRIPAVLFLEEQQHLRPLRRSIYSQPKPGSREPRLVSPLNQISVGSVKYPVPEGYRGLAVDVLLQGDTLHVFDQITGEEIAVHQKSLFPGTTSRERGFKRRKKLDLLQEELLASFAFPEWQDFVCRNRRTYTRYFRDQVKQFHRTFTEETDPSLFLQAVQLCLELKTVSMNDLRDVYVHLSSEQNPPGPDLGPPPPRNLSRGRPRRAVPVAIRKLDVYRNLLREEVAS